MRALIQLRNNESTNSRYKKQRTKPCEAFLLCGMFVLARAGKETKLFDDSCEKGRTLVTGCKYVPL